MMTKYDHDKISHQKLGLNWDWISTQAKTIPFMHDTETKQSSLNSIPILVLGNLATFFLYSWKRVTYDHDHDPHLTHNVCWVFSIRHLEERQWRQNIKREMLLQTWLWSVEMGANIAENGGRKNISKDITGEGRRVFATLTCWVGTGGEEIWSCESWTADSSPCSRSSEKATKPCHRHVNSIFACKFANFLKAEDYGDT